MSPDIQREVEEAYLYNQNSLCANNFELVYGYLIHIIPELCFEFHVIDVGFIMALLRRDYSCRHQLIIWEIVLEKNSVP